MSPVSSLGKVLIMIGAVCLIFGALLSLSGRISWLGHLPGDFFIRRKNFSFYFPLTSSILISLILSLLFRIFSKH